MIDWISFTLGFVFGCCILGVIVIHKLTKLLNLNERGTDND